jgi:hypothetical protein
VVPLDGWALLDADDRPDGARRVHRRTVHVGDIAQAWDADSPDPDDFIGSDKVGGGRGTLVFVGDDAKYRAVYHRGAADLTATRCVNRRSRL